MGSELVARGQRALLEADDAVGDVRGVRVDRRHADRREVVREVAPRVELAVLGAVAAALLVGGAPGEVTEEAGPAGGYAPEALYQEQRDLVVLVAQRVVVVALVEGLGSKGGDASGGYVMCSQEQSIPRLSFRPSSLWV